ncbi:hypothetical protein [Colwellia hornerae]|uniref:Uncharacterized protein n=1 Tax=Colwellia hornerae TaxID=89402 RepID=A0A5C6QE82_9GAMM|nr:hypothetical protein [Colwellia hornerae]TWX59374.1 hypothetical protein ESZ28_00020 [Colwellia hornerae]TWX62744.1 hypothetical protein ESZ26_00015 [Colwellia hornerae]TWX67058.1 hypothetical protein ESZ27_09255 [Colwellia hornerae]
MYSQFTVANELPPTPDALNYQKCLIVGNYLMIISLLVVTSSIFITFAFDQLFSIAVQISAHISTIVFAGLLKIGYVLRCVALHGFGQRSF